MSQHTCATVKIAVEASEDNPTGVVIINESDYDAEIHKLYEPKEEASQPVEQPVEQPVQTGAAPWNVK